MANEERKLEIEQYTEKAKITMKFIEELPVPIDVYMLFYKHQRLINWVCKFGGYIYRDLFIKYLNECFGVNKNTASKIIADLVEKRLFGIFGNGNYKVLYLKERAINCLNLSRKEQTKMKIKESRINNTGMIRNTLIALYSLENLKNSEFRTLIRINENFYTAKTVSNDKVLIYLNTSSQLNFSSQKFRTDTINMLYKYKSDKFVILTMNRCNSNKIKNSYLNLRSDTKIIDFEEEMSKYSLECAKQRYKC